MSKRQETITLDSLDISEQNENDKLALSNLASQAYIFIYQTEDKFLEIIGETATSNDQSFAKGKPTEQSVADILNQVKNEKNKLFSRMENYIKIANIEDQGEKIRAVEELYLSAQEEYKKLAIEFRYLIQNSDYLTKCLKRHT